MTVRVLVVDDSSFFRRRVSEILNADDNIEVIGTAADGAAAVREARSLKPDVITMDIEMPVLDGISAVRQIMAESPTAILMFSSLTHEGAKATLDALEAGAVDFLPKKFEDIARNRDDAVAVLQQRVREIARKPGMRRPASTPVRRPEKSATSLRERSSTVSVPPASRPQRPVLSPAAKASTGSADEGLPGNQLQTNSRYKLFAIGTSTGGPVALQKILTSIPANFPYPIVLVQHMPASFTKAFAQRLDGLCKITVKEAEDGDVLRPGTAYLAPGGMQMLADGRAGQARLRIRADDSERITYRPSVDLTFASLSKVFGGEVFGVILTGMGADGREGCRMLKDQGATIWAQDQESCVVYGMPQAVTAAGIATQSYSLDQMAGKILREVGYT
ncbi:chemotaxis response regulator protein-glutamate methylesterase [Aliidiomarina sedimenti]|uniref:Protein-glutamate methylesterase/protein-glutamine glutaminase n=1 Tax=Aliidiomarina sedimenti TaxID=1933879 RepID=A0ABY0BZE6_9GAMM|nr:chemotaxis response regulator protein-glutamate methylesterase [Aliidiomarina sedimenti]RUO29917.1 chemotaxis response regulator protein-glutamate methylesterase [Aliidiomarina sedimenti]